MKFEGHVALLTPDGHELVRLRLFYPSISLVASLLRPLADK